MNPIDVVVAGGRVWTPDGFLDGADVHVAAAKVLGVMPAGTEVPGSAEVIRAPSRANASSARSLPHCR